MKTVARVVGLHAVAFAVLCGPGSAQGLPSISATHFKSASTCICHGEQLGDWRLSMHAKALIDPVYILEKSRANKATENTLGPFCDTCHTPIGTMAGQTTGDHALSKVSKEGVTCDFCHQVTGTKQPIGNASQRLKANGTKRAQLSDASSPVHATAYSRFHTRAEFCGACHYIKSPISGVTLDSTYPDWKAGPYAKLGVVCQDCHMSLTPGGGPSTGRAASMGPIRSYIYLMTFAGANVPLGNAVRATQILESAAKVAIEAPGVLEEGQTADVKVTVANVGAGHKIPAGVSEIRQMWLDVSVVAADGSRTSLGTRTFGTVFRDAEGHYPAHAWDAVAVQSDTRIPPSTSVNSTYEFKMTGAEPVAIEAVLNYKSFPDELAKQARVKNPTTEMARATLTVYASARQRRGAVRSTGQAVFPWLALSVAALLVALATYFVLRRRRRGRGTDVPESVPSDSTGPAE